MVVTCYILTNDDGCYLPHKPANAGKITETRSEEARDQEERIDDGSEAGRGPKRPNQNFIVFYF